MIFVNGTPSIVLVGNIEGYYLSDLENHLSPGHVQELRQFLIGKTLLLIEDKEFIYKWDFEKFEARYKIVN